MSLQSVMSEITRLLGVEQQWIAVRDLVCKHCPVEAGENYIEHGIPRLARRCAEAEAAIARVLRLLEVECVCTNDLIAPCFACRVVDCLKGAELPKNEEESKLKRQAATLAAVTADLRRRLQRAEAESAAVQSRLVESGRRE